MNKIDKIYFFIYLFEPAMGQQDIRTLLKFLVEGYKGDEIV